MKTRFSTVAGFLAAASLLSGSAFAFAPEFTDDLPTVIITDKVSGGASAAFDYGVDSINGDGPFGAWGGSFRASSAFFFRFDDAIDLAPIVQLNDASALSDVRVVFQEFDNALDAIPNTTRTLKINGQDAVDSGDVVGTYPDPEEFSDFNVSGKYFTADELLSFRNIDFSPVSGATGPGPSFDPVGDVTGHNLEVSPTQERVVTLYITAPGANQFPTSFSKSFTVITSVEGDEGDRISIPVVSDPFSEMVYDRGGNFDDWQVSLWDNKVFKIPDGAFEDATDSELHLVPSTNNHAGVTINPSPVDTASPAGISQSDNAPVGTTTPLEISTNNPQSGLYGWGLDFSNTDDDLITSGPDPFTSISLEAGKLYRMRASLSSPITTSNVPLFVQFGAAYQTGTVSTGFTNPTEVTGGASVKSFPVLKPTASPFEAYLLPRLTATDDPFVSFAIIDYNTTDGQDLVIHDLEIQAAGSLSGLDGRDVFLNHGAETFTLAAGEETPSNTNRSDFQYVTGNSPQEGVPGEEWFADPDGPSLNSMVNMGVTGTASVMTVQTSLVSGADPNKSYWDFYQASLANANPTTLDTYDGGPEVSPDKIYVTKVWASTPNAGAAIPSIYIINRVDLTHFTRTQHYVHGGGTLTVPAANQLTSGAKVYTNVWRPHTPQAMGEITFDLGFLWTFTQPADPQLGNTTIRIHRVIIEEYDAPSDL